MRRIMLFLANFVIFLSTLKESILFLLNIRNFQKSQDKLFQSILKKNRITQYIQSLNNGKNVPLSNWSNYDPYIKQILNFEQYILTLERVLLLEPTSGTSSPSKYVPYTKGLQKQFNKAINPWLFGIYSKWPKLFFCSQYWSVSPEVVHSQNNKPQRITIGFEQDSQYLGKKRGNIMNMIFSVPCEIKNCDNPENWVYLTAYFLLRDRDLGLISIWHPSFLAIIIDKIKKQYSRLIDDIEKGTDSTNPILKNFRNNEKLKPDISRSQELRRFVNKEEIDFSKIWPGLKVISCWADNYDETSLRELKRLFPKVFFQPKGLIATEGIVSFPFGKVFGIPAFRSHFLEFIDLRDESVKKLNQLEKGQEYEVVITTSGGLYRYKMNDVILVKGFCMRNLPMFQFLYKRDYVSDMRGEKIGLQHVTQLETELRNKFKGIHFFMLSPVLEGSSAYYSVYIHADNSDNFPFHEMSVFADEFLKQNFHYDYARKIGQLGNLKVFKLNGSPAETIINYIESTGIKRGDIKLYPLNKLPIWHNLLDGIFVD